MFLRPRSTHSQSARSATDVACTKPWQLAPGAGLLVIGKREIFTFISGTVICSSSSSEMRLPIDLPPAIHGTQLNPAPGGVLFVNG